MSVATLGDRGVPLALVGLRAVGKSAVGRVLARRLAWPFVDLDERTVDVARHAGLVPDAPPGPSAGELLARLGELAFRDCEAQALRGLVEGGCRVVLATGGGVVERADNRAWLCRAGTVVWLRAPVERLAARLAADPTPRPALLGEDAASELGTLAARREPLYREVAGCEVDAAEGDPEAVAARVLATLGLDPKGVRPASG